jgi:predicted nucleic acid-binding protein
LTAAVRKVADSADLARLRRKTFSPVRLVLAGVVLVVGLTLSWIWHLHSLDQAERTVASALKLGELALEEDDLSEAARQFRQVRSALDVLGRNDSRARGMRQTAAELSAAADLARVSLFDLLHEASVVASGASRESWAATFRSNYRDQWVVLDARVSRIVDALDGRRYDIDFHLADGSPDKPNQAMIVADLTAFDTVISRESAGNGEPLRVIFAAQLDDCVQDPKDPTLWRIVLRPSTGILWSSVQHLELVGVTADDQTKERLTEQTQRLGIGP